MASLIDLVNSMTAPKGHAKTTGALSPTVSDLAASPITTIKQLTGQPVSQAEMDAATRGSETFFGGLSGAPEMEAAAPVIQGVSKAVANTAKTALPAIKSAGKKIAQEGVDFGGIPQGAPRTAMNAEAAVDLPTKQASSIRITLKPSVYGADREAAVQNTIDRFVPGQTAIEKYANLKPAMESFGQQITNIMAQAPKVAKLEGEGSLMADYDKNLANEGIYRTSNAPRDAVQKEARKYITRLYNNAKGVPNEIAPSEIADVDLYGLKQQVNQDAQSIFKKIENGATVTDKEKVILAARQTLDDQLSALHPEVKELTTKQSHLYDAAEPLAKERSAEFKVQPQSLLDKAKAHPLIGLGIAGAGGYGVSRIPDAVGTVAGLMQSNDSTLPAIDPDAKPKYDVATPLDDGTLISEQAQAARQSALQKQIGTLKMTDPVQAAQLQGQYDSNATEFAAQDNLRKLATSTKAVVSSANNAARDLGAADPGFINALNKGYDSAMKANGGKYARLVSDLQSLGNLSGVDLSTAKSAQALQSAIDAIVQNQQLVLQAQQTQYSGAGTKQVAPAAPISDLPAIPQQPVNWQGNDPRVEAIMR